MKAVYYSDKEIYLLTDEEFFGAVPAWEKNKKVWCERLQVLLSPHFRFAGTPREDLGYEVFMFRTRDGYQKIYKKNGAYYKLVRWPDSNETEYIHLPYGIVKEKLKDFISQEIFYKNKYDKQSTRSLSPGNE